MTDFYTRFGQGSWGSSGQVSQPTDSQILEGFAFLGSATPTAELHNWCFQVLDQKDTWLFNQLATAATAQGVTLSETTSNGLSTMLGQKAPLSAPQFTNGVFATTDSNGTYFLAGSGVANNSAMFFGNGPSGYTANLLQLGIAGTTLIAIGANGSIISTGGAGFAGTVTATTGLHAGTAPPSGHSAMVYANIPSNNTAYALQIDYNGTVGAYIDNAANFNTTGSGAFAKGVGTSGYNGTNGGYFTGGTIASGQFGAIYINAPSGYSAILMSLGINGNQLCTIDNSGNAVLAGKIYGTAGVYAGAVPPTGHSALLYVNAPSGYNAYVFQVELAGVSSIYVDSAGVFNTTANFQFGGYINQGDVWTPSYSPCNSAKPGVQVGGGGIQCFSNNNPSGYFGSGVTNGLIISVSGTAGQSLGGIYNNNNTGCSFTTASDYRLKENVVPITVEAAMARYAALRPVEYTWIAQPDAGPDTGFIAHELQEVYPRAVHGAKDAVDEDGNIAPQGVDPSKGLPHDGVVLINYLLDRVAKMEAEIQALKEGK